MLRILFTVSGIFATGCVAQAGPGADLPCDCPEASKAVALSSARAAATGTIISNRVEQDDARDINRRPKALMAFLGIKPGATVVDVGAGDGYSSLYMAQQTGPRGKIYAHNTPAWKDFLAPYVAARLKNGPLAGIEWVQAPFANPIPPGVRDVDLVTNILTYHDTLYYPVDRDAMNRNIFAALRSGGEYVVVDHAARAEDAGTVGQSLHRISEQFLIDEVRKAGFEVARRGQFLRDPTDDHTTVAWATPQPRTDRFVIAFRKP